MNIGNETETIELKKSTSETKEGIISISSILNKHGKGTLYFGVKDNGDVIGQDIGKDTLRHLSRDISGNINPSCWYEISEKRTADGAKFIEVQFCGEHVPYSAYGRYYERFDFEDKATSDLELEKLFRKRNRDYSLWEKEKSDCLIEDVDKQLFQKLFTRGRENGRIKYDFTDIKSILSKLGLIADDTYLNNAGKMLFSSKGPIILKLATFATSTKETFTRLNHFEGNIFECIDEAIRYINETIDWKIEIGANAARTEKPEIPGSAIREIVINAFAHGQYSGNTTFEIDVFKNRVQIYSPGLFPFGYTPEDFANQAEEPVMLNPKIVNVMFKVSEIESFGSGFERTFSECKKENVEYAYENTKSGFRFIFYRTNEINTIQKNKSKLSKTEEKVYEFIKKNNMITAKQIAEKIDKSTKTVYRAVKHLKELELIERVGDDYNGTWNVK